MDFDELFASKIKTKKKKKKIHNVMNSQSAHDMRKEYEEMLDQVYRKLEHQIQHKPIRKIKLIEPIVVSHNMKTCITNFKSLCESVNRNEEACMRFIQSELVTMCSLNTQKQLIIKGRYTPLKLRTILTKYINKYCKCNMCDSLDTILKKNTTSRLLILECNKCLAHRTIM